MNKRHKVTEIFTVKHDLTKMVHEENRLKTFKTWSSIIPLRPSELTRAGFFYVGIFDRVKCFSCGGQIEAWEETDTALGEHLRIYPNCTFAVNLSKDFSRRRTVDNGSDGCEYDEFFSSPDEPCRKSVQRTSEGVSEKAHHTGPKRTAMNNSNAIKSEQTPQPSKREAVTTYPYHQKESGPHTSVHKHTDSRHRDQEEPPPRQFDSIDDVMMHPTPLKMTEMGFDQALVRQVATACLQNSGGELPSLQNFMEIVLEAKNYVANYCATHDFHGRSEASISDFTRLRNCKAEIGSSESNAISSSKTSLPTSASYIVDIQAQRLDDRNLNRIPNDYSERKTSTTENPCLSSKCNTSARQDVSDVRLCKICLDSVLNTVFFPCSHAVTCVECASELRPKLCPICGRRIKRIKRIIIQNKSDRLCASPKCFDRQNLT